MLGKLVRKVKEVLRRSSKNFSLDSKESSFDAISIGDTSMENIVAAADGFMQNKNNWNNHDDNREKHMNDDQGIKNKYETIKGRHNIRSRSNGGNFSQEEKQTQNCPDSNLEKGSQSNDAQWNYANMSSSEDELVIVTDSEDVDSNSSTCLFGGSSGKLSEVSDDEPKTNQKANKFNQKLCTIADEPEEVSKRATVLNKRLSANSTSNAAESISTKMRKLSQDKESSIASNERLNLPDRNVEDENHSRLPEKVAIFGKKGKKIFYIKLNSLIKLVHTEKHALNKWADLITEENIKQLSEEDRNSLLEILAKLIEVKVYTKKRK